MVVRQLGHAIQVFARQIPLLLAISLLVYLPVNAWMNLAIEASAPESIEELGRGIRIWGLVELVFGTLASNFTILLAARTRMQHQVSFAGLMRPALANWLAMIGVTAVYNITVTVGCLFLIVPGVYFGLRWALAFPVYLLEDTDMRGAFRRSSELTSGRLWGLLGAGMLFLLSIAALSAALYSPIELGPPNLLTPATIAADTVHNMLALIWPIFVTLLYFEARSAESDEQLPEDASPYIATGGGTFEALPEDGDPYRSPRA